MNVIEGAFERTDRSLRALIERIFATNSLLTIEDLIDELTACVEIELTFLIYIRERAWFGRESRADPPEMLKFNFLSFFCCRGKVERFRSQIQLSEKEVELVEAGFQQRASDLCKIQYKYDGERDIERILNLIMRIFVAFYKNCGSHDHFRDSVSSRFIKEFFKAFPAGGLKDLLGYIRDRTSLEITLWQPSDEMFFRGKSKLPIQNLLHPFPDTPTDLPIYHEDTNFKGDLHTSVVRKNQTFGKTCDGKHHYVVKTFSVNHFSSMSSRPWEGFKERQIAVALFSTPIETNISLDAVHHAGQLITSFLNASGDRLFSDILMNADRRSLEMEIDIAENPLASRDQINDVVNSTLAPTFRELTDATRASDLFFWVYDPFDHSLSTQQEIHRSHQHHGEEPVQLDLVDDENHIAVQCFLREKTLSLSHPVWIQSELEQLEILSRRVPTIHEEKRQTLDDHLKRRSQFFNSGVNQECSCIAIPVQRAGMIVGVLEISSTTVGQMTFDSHLVNRIAIICGDCLRRAELANDRAWLTRMSFIHASRHRLEEIFRELEFRSEKVGSDLVKDLLGEEQNQGIIRGNDEIEAEEAKLMKRIRGALEAHGNDDETTSLVDHLTEYQKVCGFGRETLSVLADVVETLSSNASHSKFHLNSLSCELVEDASASRFSLIVKYEPQDVWIAEERMKQVGFAPIPSKTGYTYHYGLFLLGSQIRMLGGIVQTKESSDDIGNSQFGLAFRIPAI